MRSWQGVEITMSAEQRVAYPSPEEYLIRERRAKHRSEYENGEMIVMAGASYEHNLIITNLSGELRLRLKKSSDRKSVV